GSKLTPADREALRAHLPALFAELAAGQGGTPTGPSWDGAEAVRLMARADGLVERLGIDGRHPDVAAAASMVVSAHATRDLETVRFAVGEFTRLVWAIAAAGTEAGPPRPSGGRGERESG